LSQCKDAARPEDYDKPIRKLTRLLRIYSMRQLLKTSMTRLAAAACFVLIVASSAYAQISPQAMTLSGVSDCIKEAIASNTAEQNGSALFFSCSATTAKVLFNLIGRKIQIEAVQDRNGKFENRQFGNNACYHRIEDPTGKPADDFRCDLILLVGDSLSD
jgi:hypothetical protein